MQQVEFVQAWRGYRVGQRIMPNGVLRDWLVKAGLVKVIEDTPEEVKTRGRRRKK